MLGGLATLAVVTVADFAGLGVALGVVLEDCTRNSA